MKKKKIKTPPSVRTLVCVFLNFFIIIIIMYTRARVVLILNAGIWRCDSAVLATCPVIKMARRVCRRSVSRTCTTPVGMLRSGSAGEEFRLRSFLRKRNTLYYSAWTGFRDTSIPVLTRLQTDLCTVWFTSDIFFRIFYGFIGLLDFGVSKFETGLGLDYNTNIQPCNNHQILQVKLLRALVLSQWLFS